MRCDKTIEMVIKLQDAGNCRADVHYAAWNPTMRGVDVSKQQETMNTA